MKQKYQQRNKTAIIVSNLLICLLMLSACKGICMEEECQCKAETIELSFQGNAGNIEHLKISVLDNKLDTLNSWVEILDEDSLFEIKVNGELSGYKYFDYTDMSFVIEPENKDFKVVIDEIAFEYDEIDCNKQQSRNFCGTGPCRGFDTSTFRFKVNDMEYCHDDMPIRVGFVVEEK